MSKGNGVATPPEEEQIDVLIRKMIAGEVPPPNEIVAFLLGRLSETLKKGQQLATQLSQLRGVLEEVEQRTLRIDGLARGYNEDLKRLLSGVDSPPQEKEPAAEGEPNEANP